MARPDDSLALLRNADVKLITTAQGCDDPAIQAPSRLPGWTVGHVLTHLARNADAQVRRLDGTLDGRLVAQYEGGRDVRNAAIDAGAARSKTEIVGDLVSACEQLNRTLTSFPAELWDQAEVQRKDYTIPVATLLFTRLMEVEVHHTDLGRGYAPADWPPEFPDRALVAAIDRMALRRMQVSGSTMSWKLQRTDGIGEWLIRRTPSGSSLTTESGEADCTIRGPGSGLLAWLLGRLDCTAAGLDVQGSVASAAEFPSRYAYG